MFSDFISTVSDREIIEKSFYRENIKTTENWNEISQKNLEQFQIKNNVQTLQLFLGST